jgi:hypothetical protein
LGESSVRDNTSDRKRLFSRPFSGGLKNPAVACVSSGNEEQQQRSKIMTRRYGRHSFVLFVMAVATTNLGTGAAEGQETKQEKQERRALNLIKKDLPIKGDKDTTWYVIQLDTVTTSTTYSGSYKKITIGSKIRLEKVQGQDKAAKVILDHLTSPTPGNKVWYRDVFPGTDAGVKQMEKHVEKLNLLGAMNGYR